MNQPRVYRPMLQPFEQQLPPGADTESAEVFKPCHHPARRASQPNKGRLLAICTAGHGLTALNSQAHGDGSRTCFLCEKAATR